MQKWQTKNIIKDKNEMKNRKITWMELILVKTNKQTDRQTDRQKTNSRQKRAELTRKSYH